MLDDIIPRLRSAATWVDHQATPAPPWDELLAEAADEIEQLRREAVGHNARLTTQAGTIRRLTTAGRDLHDVMVAQGATRSISEAVDAALCRLGQVLGVGTPPGPWDTTEVDPDA